MLAIGCSSSTPDQDSGAPHDDGGTDTDSAVEGGRCEADLADAEQYGWSTSPAWSVRDYEGTAVVERSTSDALLLYVETASTDSGGARSLIQSARGLPLLEPGSRVWLFQSGNRVPSDRGPGVGAFQPPRSGRRLAVRDREHGTLLLGAVSDVLDDAESMSEPLALRAPMMTCSETQQDCPGDVLVTYYDVEAAADTPVRVGAGERRDITLDGIDYELMLTATSRELAKRSGNCADFFGFSPGVWVDASIAPMRPSDVTGGLDTGAALPACVVGNDPAPFIAFGVYEAPIGTEFEGEVSYSGRVDEGGREELRFARADGPDTFYITPTSGFVEPAIGEHLWVDVGLRRFVLKRSRDGELLLASAWSSDATPLADADAAQLSSWLGVGVRVEPDCMHEPGVQLFTTVFATEPETRVRTGSSASLAIGGQSYRASVGVETAGNYWTLSIVPSAQ